MNDPMQILEDAQKTLEDIGEGVGANAVLAACIVIERWVKWRFEEAYTRISRKQMAFDDAITQGNEDE